MAAVSASLEQTFAKEKLVVLADWPGASPICGSGGRAGPFF